MITMDENCGMLKEAVMRDPDRWPDGWNGYIEEAKRSTFLRRLTKVGIQEGLFSDMAGALGAIHAKVVEAARPKLIGRDIISVVETTEALERFYKAKLAKAYVVGETEPPEVPERMETQDVKCTIEIASKAEFSRTFIEDASWSVLARAAEEHARAVAQLETEKVLALYNAIADADLATGATIATNEGASFAWTDLAKLWNAVQREDFEPSALAIKTRELEGLVQQTQMIQSLYYAPETAVRRGVFELPHLGMKIVHSSLVPAVDATHNTKFAIDVENAAVMLLRRDITTEPFENPGKLRSGIIVSERIGLDVLRSKGVAKGV